LRSKALLIPTIVVFIAVVIMLRLGIWQLERSEYKQQRLLQIEQRQQLKSFTLSDVINTQQDVRDLPITVQGKVLSTHLLLLDNRIFKGQVGYEVVLPVLTNQGILLTNLGWVKAGRYRDQLPVISLHTIGPEFSGILSKPGLNPMVKETTNNTQAWPRVIQQIDLELIDQWFPQKVLPFTLLAAEGSTDFEHNWQPVVMPPEKHIAYAVQWFGLALACALVYLFAIIKIRKKDDS